MTIRIRFFAALRERAGLAQATRVTPSALTVGDLWGELCREHPSLAAYGGRIAFAVNQEYVDSTRTLQDNDEVAFIPPVSGGVAGSRRASMFEITDNPIDVARLVTAVTRPEAGAIVTFLGTTRDHNSGRRVTLLEYEAYPEMAVREMRRIGDEAIRRFGAAAVAIVHRTGVVAIGEVSVAIAVSAAHRDAAYTASRFSIDRLKEIVPIWKKEHYEGGEIWIGPQQGGLDSDHVEAKPSPYHDMR